MHHCLMVCHRKKEGGGCMVGRESEGGGSIGRGGGCPHCFCCFIATSAHYEEDNELGNFRMRGRTFESENKPHIELGESGGGERE